MGEHRLVILSGPSCAGKSPLRKALARFYPELSNRLDFLVLYNDRDPRPGERDGVDYHFRTREQIEKLGDDKRYALFDVRGDLQALDIEELKGQLQQSDAMFEGNAYVGSALLTNPALQEVPKLSVYLAPLSRAEILYLKEQDARLEPLVADVMRRKLLRRTRKQKSELSLKDLETVERRCTKAYTELKEAWRFAHVVPNHDGEDSENWDAFCYLLGDARHALETFAALLRGDSAETERWEENLLP